MRVHALSASLEDYLEAIYQIVLVRKAARPRDITRRLRVGSSSVTGALHALAERGLIEYAPHEWVTLTPQGTRAAREVVRRHESLRDFLVNVLGVEPGLAEADACKMEHALSREASERFVQFVRFTQTCPLWTGAWAQRLKECMRDAPHAARCASCAGTVPPVAEGHEGGAKHGTPASADS